MKEFLKNYGTLIVSIVFGALDLVLRNFPSTRLEFLVQPLVSINILEIAFVTVLAWYSHRFIPSVYKKRRNCKRAEKLLNNWNGFKDVLRRYCITGEKNQEVSKEYSRLRSEIEKDFYYFLTDITEVQNSTRRDNQEQKFVLRNFEKCLAPHEIDGWYRTVQRKIPDELNCFDYLLIGLVGHFKR